MAFNPISKSHWLYNFCVESPPESFRFSVTTYRDNPFLSPEYVASLEEMRRLNPQKARVYCDAEWGIISDALVFNPGKWRVVPSILADMSPDVELRAGLDLGWIDKTAAVLVGWSASTRRIYVLREFYKSGVQLDELSSALGRLLAEADKHLRLQCDSAEPRTIDYLRRQGFNAVAAVKGRDSVKAGLMFL